MGRVDAMRRLSAPSPVPPSPAFARDTRRRFADFTMDAATSCSLCTRSNPVEHAVSAVIIILGSIAPVKALPPRD